MGFFQAPKKYVAPKQMNSTGKETLPKFVLDLTSD